MGSGEGRGVSEGGDQSPTDTTSLPPFFHLPLPANTTNPFIQASLQAALLALRPPPLTLLNSMFQEELMIGE